MNSFKNHHICVLPMPSAQLHNPQIITVKVATSQT